MMTCFSVEYREVGHVCRCHCAVSARRCLCSVSRFLSLFVAFSRVEPLTYPLSSWGMFSFSRGAGTLAFPSMLDGVQAKHIYKMCLGTVQIRNSLGETERIENTLEGVSCDKSWNGQDESHSKRLWEVSRKTRRFSGHCSLCSLSRFKRSFLFAFLFENICNAWVRRPNACVAAEGGFLNSVRGGFTTYRSKTQRKKTPHKTRHLTLHGTLYRHCQHTEHRQHVV